MCFLEFVCFLCESLPSPGPKAPFLRHAKRLGRNTPDDDEEEGTVDDDEDDDEERGAVDEKETGVHKHAFQKKP